MKTEENPGKDFFQTQFCLAEKKTAYAMHSAFLFINTESRVFRIDQFTPFETFLFIKWPWKYSAQPE